jgi:hypothetical protein
LKINNRELITRFHIPLFTNLSVLFKSSEFTPSGIPEICTELYIVSSDKVEFKVVIDLLAMSFIEVIVKENSLYYHEVSEDITTKRLNKIGGSIYETSK